MIKQLLEASNKNRAKLNIGRISKSDIDWYKNVSIDDFDTAFENLIDKIYEKYPKFNDEKYGLPYISVLDFELDYKDDGSYCDAWYDIEFSVDIINSNGDDRPATSKEIKDIKKWLEKNVEVDDVDCGYGGCSITLGFDKPIYFNFSKNQSEGYITEKEYVLKLKKNIDINLEGNRADAARCIQDAIEFLYGDLYDEIEDEDLLPVLEVIDVEDKGNYYEITVESDDMNKKFIKWFNDNVYISDFEDLSYGCNLELSYKKPLA